MKLEHRGFRTASPARYFPVRPDELHFRPRRQIEQQRHLFTVEFLRKRNDRLEIPGRAVGGSVDANVERLLLDYIRNRKSQKKDAALRWFQLNHGTISLGGDHRFLGKQESIRHVGWILAERNQLQSSINCWGGVEELAEQGTDGIRLLPRREVAGLGDDLQLAACNVLTHEFPVGGSGKDVFVSNHNQRRHIDRLQIGNRIGALRHPPLHQADVLRRHFAHHAASTVYQVWTCAKGC